LLGNAGAEGAVACLGNLCGVLGQNGIGGSGASKIPDVGEFVSLSVMMV
jgi:hypothetical protein